MVSPPLAHLLTFTIYVLQALACPRVDGRPEAASAAHTDGPTTRGPFQASLSMLLQMKSSTIIHYTAVLSGSACGVTAESPDTLGGRRLHGEVKGKVLLIGSNTFALLSNQLDNICPVSPRPLPRLGLTHTMLERGPTSSGKGHFQTQLLHLPLRGPQKHTAS